MYMPSQALAAVLLNPSHLPTSTRLTLAVLTAHMHEDRTQSHVSAACIARIRGVGERSVRRHLEDLVRFGLLIKHLRPGTSTMYEITFPVSEHAVTLRLPGIIPTAKRQRRSKSRATVQFAAAVYHAMESLSPQVYAKDVASVLGCSPEEARRALKIARITPTHGSAKAETGLVRHPSNRVVVTPPKTPKSGRNRVVATEERSSSPSVLEEEPNGSSSRERLRRTRVETHQDEVVLADVIDLRESNVSNLPLEEVVAMAAIWSPLVVSRMKGGTAVEQLFTRNRVSDDALESDSTRRSLPRGAKPITEWTPLDSAEEIRLRYVQRHGFCHINVRRLAMILGRQRKLQSMDARHEIKTFDRWVDSKYAEGDGDPVARYLASFPYHRFTVEQEIAEEDPTYVNLTERNRGQRVEEAQEEMIRNQAELMDYYEEMFGA